MTPFDEVHASDAVMVTQICRRMVDYGLKSTHQPLAEVAAEITGLQLAIWTHLQERGRTTQESSAKIHEG
jgi:hypothetical protein